MRPRCGRFLLWLQANALRYRLSSQTLRAKNMRFILSLIFGILLLAGQATTPFAAESAARGPNVLLLQKHLGKGVNCAGCHAEAPPAKAVAMAKCLTCHGGSYEKLAAKSEGKGEHNPHASHQGDLSCDSCHNIHKPSVNYCAQCHQFEFTVP